MRRGIPARSSQAAGWARLLGGLAVPVLVIGVAGARVGLVPQGALPPVLVAGFTLGFLALTLAFYSLADIWSSGAEGASSAIAGIIYAAPAVLVLGVVAAAAVGYPRLTDIATDVDDPPLFTASGAPLGRMDPADANLQRSAYPQIVPHLYPTILGDTYLAARRIFERRRWAILRDVHAPDLAGSIEGAEPTQAIREDDEVALALSLKSVMTQSRTGAATEIQGGPIAPLSAAAEVVSPDNEATIEGTAPSLVFGFPDNVVVRLQATPQGTRVDMRSASQTGKHDLGENARRISSFFRELDSVLQPDPADAAAR